MNETKKPLLCCDDAVRHEKVLTEFFTFATTYKRDLPRFYAEQPKVDPPGSYSHAITFQYYEPDPAELYHDTIDSARCFLYRPPRRDSDATIAMLQGLRLDTFVEVVQKDIDDYEEKHLVIDRRFRCEKDGRIFGITVYDLQPRPAPPDPNSYVCCTNLCSRAPDPFRRSPGPEHEHIFQAFLEYGTTTKPVSARTLTKYTFQETLDGFGLPVCTIVVQHRDDHDRLLTYQRYFFGYNRASETRGFGCSSESDDSACEDEEPEDGDPRDMTSFVEVRREVYRAFEMQFRGKLKILGRKELGCEDHGGSYEISACWVMYPKRDRSDSESEAYSPGSGCSTEGLAPGRGEDDDIGDSSDVLLE